MGVYHRPPIIGASGGLWGRAVVRYCMASECSIAGLWRLRRVMGTGMAVPRYWKARTLDTARILDGALGYGAAG